MENRILTLQKLRQQVATRDAYLQAKEKNLKAKKSLLRNRTRGMMGDTVTDTSEPNLAQAMQANLPAGLLPGNVGDVNRVIWPFYFTTEFAPILPNTAFRSGFNITQEACFIWMSYTKAVFIQDEDGDLSYIDPDQPGATGCAFNLSMTIRDSSSERDFENFPFEMDNVGHPNYPTKFPRPSLFAPNANIEISFQNDDPDLIYLPFVTAFGYRMRLEDARTMLSFVTA